MILRVVALLCGLFCSSSVFAGPSVDQVIEQNRYEPLHAFVFRGARLPLVPGRPIVYTDHLLYIDTYRFLFEAKHLFGIQAVLAELDADGRVNSTPKILPIQSVVRRKGPQVFGKLVLIDGSEIWIPPNDSSAMAKLPPKFSRVLQSTVYGIRNEVHDLKSLGTPHSQTGMRKLVETLLEMGFNPSNPLNLPEGENVRGPGALSVQGAARPPAATESGPVNPSLPIDFDIGRIADINNGAPPNQEVLRYIYILRSELEATPVGYGRGVAQIPVVKIAEVMKRAYDRFVRLNSPPTGQGLEQQEMVVGASSNDVYVAQGTSSDVPPNPTSEIEKATAKVIDVVAKPATSDAAGASVPEYLLPTTLLIGRTGVYVVAVDARYSQTNNDRLLRGQSHSQSLEKVALSDRRGRIDQAPRPFWQNPKERTINGTIETTEIDAASLFLYGLDQTTRKFIPIERFLHSFDGFEVRRKASNSSLSLGNLNFIFQYRNFSEDSEIELGIDIASRSLLDESKSHQITAMEITRVHYNDQRQNSAMWQAASRVVLLDEADSMIVRSLGDPLTFRRELMRGKPLDAKDSLPGDGRRDWIGNTRTNQVIGIDLVVPNPHALSHIEVIRLLRSKSDLGNPTTLSILMDNNSSRDQVKPPKPLLAKYHANSSSACQSAFDGD
jgi:hypothetical protein